MIKLIYKKFCLWRAKINYVEADILGTIYEDIGGYRKHIEIAERWVNKVRLINE